MIIHVEIGDAVVILLTVIFVLALFGIYYLDTTRARPP